MKYSKIFIYFIKPVSCTYSITVKIAVASIGTDKIPLKHSCRFSDKFLNAIKIVYATTVVNVVSLAGLGSVSCAVTIACVFTDTCLCTVTDATE